MCTFNLEDVRTDDLATPNQPRLKKLAGIIQRIHPDILFLNEIAYDQEGAPGFVAGSQPGQNARRFAEAYLGVSQGEGLAPLKFASFMAPSNTGISSGHDLDNSSGAIATFPTPPAAASDGSPGEQTPEGRAYGNDCFGFGTFPGQYAMALLVREGLTIKADQARTFQHLTWASMPGALLPEHIEGAKKVQWYDDDEKKILRLSSKSHWDVPVELTNGTTIHVLCSHPTPPAFDGPENRNKNRNHDEVRFWKDYLEGAAYIVDDHGTKGGLANDAPFVIVGDLNADPKDGSSVNSPIGSLLGTCPRIELPTPPRSSRSIQGLDPDDTSAFKLRVDYVLPSKGLRIAASGVVRDGHDVSVDQRGRISASPSDHFPVWADVEVPIPAAPAATPASPAR